MYKKKFYDLKIGIDKIMERCIENDAVITKK